MVDARNFLLNSDYPMDQIVGFMSDSFTVADGALATNDYPHTLGFAPLPVGSWSYQADFEASYPAIIDLNGSGARPSVTIQANSAHVRVNVDNFTGSDKTIYWRVFFLIPSNVDLDVASTTVDSLSLPFSSDYNYTKLLDEGYETSATTVSHDLGYRPQVELWAQRTTGYLERFETSDAIAFTEYAEVTTTGLVLQPDGSTTSGIHYRIYADD